MMAPRECRNMQELNCVSNDFTFDSIKSWLDGLKKCEVFLQNYGVGLGPPK